MDGSSFVTYTLHGVRCLGPNDARPNHIVQSLSNLVLHAMFLICKPEQNKCIAIPIPSPANAVQ